MARNDNLRLLDENEKRENRSVLTGLYGKVRLTRLHRCENRTVLNPPPILEARGLPTDLLLVVPQGPDACVADLKAASLAADANAGVALNGIQVLRLSQGVAPLVPFLCRSREPGGEANQLRPMCFPEMEGGGIGIDQLWVVSAVVGQHWKSAVE